MIEVQVAKLYVGDKTNNAAVILKELEGDRVLPIWIGSGEANAIAMVLQGQSFPRPLTHDLVASIVRGLRASITKVLISDLRDKTFYATVLVHGSKEELTFDARPSDSIALALRAGCPIFVSEKLLEAQGERVDPLQMRPPSAQERAEELRRHLERLSPEDFGKFQI